MTPLEHEAQKLAAFLEQAAALHRVPHHHHGRPGHVTGPEVKPAVKLGHRLEDVGRGQAGIIHHALLVAGGAVDQGVILEEALLPAEIVEFGARVRGGQRDLDGVRVQFAGEADGGLDGRFGFARAAPP